MCKGPEVERSLGVFQKQKEGGCGWKGVTEADGGRLGWTALVSWRPYHGSRAGFPKYAESKGLLADAEPLCLGSQGGGAQGREKTPYSSLLQCHQAAN